MRKTNSQFIHIGQNIPGSQTWSAEDYI